MTGPARFVCSDPDAGDFEFADVEAVLDALEAALLQPATPIFDAARQSWQPVGLHPEIRAAWEARLHYRPPSASGLANLLRAAVGRPSHQPPPTLIVGDGDRPSRAQLVEQQAPDAFHLGRIGGPIRLARRIGRAWQRARLDVAARSVRK